jgi:hypothetical protein
MINFTTGSTPRPLCLVVVGIAAMMFAGGRGASAAGDPKPSGGATLPAGTILHLHLKTTVSTKTSKEGQEITASLVREATLQDGVALPLGSTLHGIVERCSQPETPDQRAQLLLSFRQIDIAGEGTLKLKGHVTAVSNARESLLADGTIVGVLETEAPVSLLGGVLQKIGERNSSIGDQIQKQKIGQVNTAIELPAGSDLRFTLTEPLTVKRLVATSPGRLPGGMHEIVASVLTDAPQRAQNKENKPGDPINLVLVGTQQEIEQAFRQAGWTEPKRKNQESILRTVGAVMSDEGYGSAPVSDLYLFGRREDLAFQKTLNTFNKRHHLRLWQTTTHAPDGRPVWLAAATHDIGLDIHPGVVSHSTDPDLDDERAQVGADLVEGGAVQATEFVMPPNPLSKGMTATGGAWHTDGRLLAIALKPGVVQ